MPPTRTTKFAGKKDTDSFYAWLNPRGMEIEEHYDPARLMAEFVEVDAETYEHFRGCLPPMNFTSRGFAICEAATGDIRLAFFRYGARYFAAHISDRQPPYTMADTAAFIAANAGTAQ